MAEFKTQQVFSGGELEQKLQGHVVHDQLAVMRSYVVSEPCKCAKKMSKTYELKETDSQNIQVGSKTAEQSAQDLIETIPKAIVDGWKDNEDPDDSEDDYDAVYDAVDTLIGTLQYTAIENPAHQPAIVKLLQSIQQLPPQTVQAPSQETQNIVWSNMPHFTPYLTDMYEYQQYLFISSASPPPDSVILKWASVNAWIARLVSTRIDVIGGVDYYMHRASCCFLRVLDVEGHPHFKDDIPATANLFRYASPVILRLCRDEVLSVDPPIGILSKHSREGSEGKKQLWTKLGYSMDRWIWWKTRWGQLLASSELDEGFKGHVKDALSAMRMAEL